MTKKIKKLSPLVPLCFTHKYCYSPKSARHFPHKKNNKIKMGAFRLVCSTEKRLKGANFKYYVRCLKICALKKLKKKTKKKERKEEEKIKETKVNKISTL